MRSEYQARAERIPEWNSGSIKLYLDFETRSVISLPDRGLDVYVKHPTTAPLMLSFAYGQDTPSLYQPHINGRLPDKLRSDLTDPSVLKIAWNCSFERNILKYKFGIDVPLDQWLDPMILSRMMSVPGNLDEACQILRVPPEETKKESGKDLIKFFCEPCYMGGEETLFGISEPEFRNWDTHPREWEEFCSYCCSDVIAERAVLRKLDQFPLPEIERRGWILDQKINERGIMCDLSLARGGTSIAGGIKERLRGQIKELSGVENPGSRDQLLAWIKTQGYTFSGLAKPFVNRAMAGECQLTPAARKVIELRKQTAKTSDSKLGTMIDIVSDDGRMRHQFAYLGAPRTGRWAGLDFQAQNIPTPTKHVSQNLELAIDLIRNKDEFGLETEFPSVMEAVAGIIRSTFIASLGNQLLVADESAIENRVIGWLTGCEAITNVFRRGHDPYIDFATRFYKQSYEELWAEYKSGNKTKRTACKPATLGAGFGLSGGEEVQTTDEDIVKTGLWGYAWNMGVKLTREEAHEMVKIFRDSYPEVVNFWYSLEEGAIRAIENPGTVVTSGFTRLRGTDQKTEIKFPIQLQAFGKSLFRMLLPSGRGLHYLRPQIDEEENPKTGRPRKKITVEGKDQKTKQWVRMKTYGSKLVENAVQAIARDVLLNAMLEADSVGLPIVLHCHDEIGCDVSPESGLGLEDLKRAMVKPPIWAPDLLLGAEGYVSYRYRKD